MVHWLSRRPRPARSSISVGTSATALGSAWARCPQPTAHARTTDGPGLRPALIVGKQGERGCNPAPRLSAGDIERITSPEAGTEVLPNSLRDLSTDGGHVRCSKCRSWCHLYTAPPLGTGTCLAASCRWLPRSRPHRRSLGRKIVDRPAQSAPGNAISEATADLCLRTGRQMSACRPET